MVRINTHRDPPSDGEIDWSLFRRKPLIIGEAPVPHTDLTAFPLWEFTDETRTKRRIQSNTRELLKSVFAGSDQLISLKSPVDWIRAEKLYGRLLSAFELTNLLPKVQRPKSSAGKSFRPPEGDPFDIEVAATTLSRMLKDVDNYDHNRIGGVVPTLYGRFVFMFGRSGVDTCDRVFGSCDLSTIRTQSGHAAYISGIMTKDGILAKSCITLLYHFQNLVFATKIEELYAKDLTRKMLQAAYNATFPDY